MVAGSSFLCQKKAWNTEMNTIEIFALIIGFVIFALKKYVDYSFEQRKKQEKYYKNDKGSVRNFV